MKKSLIVAALLFFTSYIYSQDLIVTSEGDSINCKIAKIKSANIYFTFKHKNEIRNTLLPVTSVKAYKIDYYSHNEVPKGKIVRSENYQHFRMGFNTGYSYQTAGIHESVPSDFKNYVNGLKSGYHFGFDLTYYFSEPLGLGFKYFMFQSSNSIDNIYIEDSTGFRQYGKMSDDLKISFIGPMFSTRLLSDDKKNALLMSLAIGHMGYSNNKIIVNNYKMTGNTVGLAFEIGYDVGLSENISLGFQVSMITGALFEYDWHDGNNTEKIKLKEGEAESLNRVDFSVGLRFSK